MPPLIKKWGTVAPPAPPFPTPLIMKTVQGIDKEKLVLKCNKKSLSIADVTSTGVCGTLLCMLEPGTPLAYVDLMAHHGLGLHPCPLCNKHARPIGTSVPHHTVCVHHCELGLNLNLLLY